MKDIRQDLEDRLALLRVRYEVAFHVKGGHWPIGPLAAALENGMHNGLDSAVRMVRALVDPGELESAKFWGTPLGVLLFSAGGFTDLACPQTVAAAVLRCSRQYVHELIVSGKLLSVAPPVGSTSGRMVESAGVRVLVMKKIDRLVN
jgi:hypothetical protein